MTAQLSRGILPRVAVFALVALLTAGTAWGALVNVIVNTNGSTSTVTANTGGGPWPPNGADLVLDGSSPVYTFTAQAGTFAIGTVLADGAAQAGPPATYTFTNITPGIHTLNVTFVRTGCVITPVSTSTGQGTVAPTGAQTVTLGNTLSVTLTPGTVSGVAYQVYQYRIVTGGVPGAWIDLPPVSSTNLHRKTTVTISAGPPRQGTTADIIAPGNADSVVEFNWEPKYDLTIVLTGPQDYLDDPMTYPGFLPSPTARPVGPNPLVSPSARYRLAGTLSLATQRNAYFYGDTVPLSVTGVNPNYKFGEDDGQRQLSSSTTYWFSQPAGMVRWTWSPPNYPPPVNVNVDMFANTTVGAWFVRAKSLTWDIWGTWGGATGVWPLWNCDTTTVDNCNNIFEPLDSVIARGIRYNPRVFHQGPAAQVRMEDEMPLAAASNYVGGPSGPMSIDLKLETGTAGAILFRPTGFDYTPRNTSLDNYAVTAPGTAQFGKLQLDRVGVNYQLQVQYPITWCNSSGGVISALTYDGVNPPPESLLVLNSTAFHIMPAETAHFAWGYNYFGQLGIGMVAPFTQNKTDQTGLPLAANWQGGAVSTATGQLSPPQDARITGSSLRSPVGFPADYVSAVSRNLSWQTGRVNKTEVRVGTTILSPDVPGTAPIEIIANGIENSVSFSLNFDAGAVAYVAGSATLGAGLPPGTTLATDESNRGGGYIGFMISLPAGEVLPAGAQTLLSLGFAAAGSAPNTSVYFTGWPVGQSVTDALGAWVPTTWTTGVINPSDSTIRVPSDVLAPGATKGFSVLGELLGGETQMAFSLWFTPGDIAYVVGSSALGGGLPSGTKLTVDESGAAWGWVGYTIALPSGIGLSAGPQTLVTMSFTGVNGAGTDLQVFPSTALALPYPHFVDDDGSHIKWLGWTNHTWTIGTEQRWRQRYYAYPDDTFVNGRDHFEPVQPYHQELSHGFMANQEAFNAVAVGQHHSLALRATGVLWSWGDNQYGQLGLGPNVTPTYVNPGTNPPVTNAFADPQQVTLVTDVIGMAAGFHHTIILKGDGTVWTCGRNNFGQLGYGTQDDVSGGHPTPGLVQVQVLGQTQALSDIVSVAAGDYYSLALQRDGAVWGWGYNANGELGDGTQTHRFSPVQVGITGAIPFRATKFYGHTGRVQAIVYSPTANFGGRFTVLTGGYDSTARVWDADTGALLLTIGDASSAGQNAHTGPVNAVAFSPDGSIVVTASADRTVRLWSTTNGAYLGSLVDTTLSSNTNTTDAHLGSVTGVVYSIDGSKLFTVSVDGTAKLWNAAAPRARLLTINNVSAGMGFTAGVFSTSAAYVYTASIDKKVAIWNALTGAFVGFAVDPAIGGGMAHTATVNALAAISNGANDLLVSGSADCSAKLWTITPAGSATLTQTMKCLFDGNTSGHYDAVLGVAIVRDATSGLIYVLTGSKDKTIKRWLALTGVVDESYRRHSGPVNGVAFAGNNGKRVLSCSNDMTARMGDIPIVVQIDGGTSHSVAVKEDGSVWTWGYNNFGQLGNGGTASSLTPVAVVGLPLGATGASAGNTHTAAVLSDGSVWSWGSNLYGELALGPGTVNAPPFSAAPRQAVDSALAPLTGIQGLSAGWGYTLARGTSGVYGWGHNNHGQLGIDGPRPGGSSANIDQSAAFLWTSPTAPLGTWYGNSPMTSLSAGYWHSQIVQSTNLGAPYLHKLTWQIDPNNQPLGGAVIPDTSIATATSQSGIPGQTVYTYTPTGGVITSGTVEGASGTQVRLLAIARPGYTFNHWDGYAASQSTQATWVFNNYAENDPATPLNLYAHFTAMARQYRLTIETYVDGVKMAGPLVTGAGTYNENDVATITATTDSQYKFLSWGDPNNVAQDIANSKVSPAFLRMDQDKTIVANFTRQQYKLDVIALDGAGKPVTGVSTVGTGTYNANFTVTVSVTGLASAGYRFGGWVVDSGSGPVVSTNNPADPSEATIVVTTNTAIHATVIKIWTITVTSVPVGIGTVSDGIVPTPVACPFVGTYDDNDAAHPVTLLAGVTAAASAAGWKFSKWTGDIDSGANPYAIGPVTKSYSLQANFIRDNTLTVVVSPIGSATFTQLPNAASYVSGTVVTVAVTPAAGYQFRDWTGGATGTSPTIQVTMNADVVAQANLQHIVSVQSSGVKNVPIAATGGFIGTVTTDGSCGVDDGASLTLTAPAQFTSGGTTYYFRMWTLDGVSQTAGQNVLTLASVKTAPVTVAVYGDDNIAPSVSLEIPSVALQVPRDTLLQIYATDSQSGVDYKTVTITVNGDTIYLGSAETTVGVYDTTPASFVQAVKGICYRVAAQTNNEWRFVFLPSAPFDYGQQVTVVVNASDRQANAVTPGFQRQFSAVMRSFAAGALASTDAQGAIVHDHASSARSPAGDQWIVWDQTASDGNTYVYCGIRRANATAFGRSVQISAGSASSQAFPVIAYSSADTRFYVAWQDMRSGVWNTRVAYSTDGVTWVESGVDASAFAQTHPTVGVDTTGKVYVAHEDARNVGILHVRVYSSTNGVVWALETAVPAAKNQTEPCLAVSTKANQVYILWTDARNVGGIYGTEIWGTSRSTLGVWAAASVVANDPKGQMSPALAIETGTTDLHIAWASLARGNYDVYYCFSAGGLPTAAQIGANATADPAEQLAPSLIVNGAGATAQIYLAWQDRRLPTFTGDADIYFADIRAGAIPNATPPWTNILVDPNAAAAFEETLPSVGLDEANRPVIYYTSTNGSGGKDILFNAATAAGPNKASVTTPVDHTKAATRQVVGTSGAVTGPTDVLVQIPANAMTQNTVISIADVFNPPPLPSPGGFGVPYTFGVSGLQFATPVTISIPHTAASCPRYGSYQVYWLDPLNLVSPWSQTGISGVQHLVLSPTLHVVQFSTSHFTAFATAGTGSPQPPNPPNPNGGGGGGGGGCFIATSGYELPTGVAGVVNVDNAVGSHAITAERLRRLDEIRALRDGLILRVAEGRAFTAWYYAVSPYAADAVRFNEPAKSALRAVLLEPLANLSNVCAEAGK
jgi:alpha-tubulin suppressor-like RCC1 family protein